MLVKTDENIGDSVTLSNGSEGKILAISIVGPNENLVFEIGWWDNNQYNSTNHYKFEFALITHSPSKVGFSND